MKQSDQLLNDIQWNADGLIPAIAQDAASGKVLMMAWMNGEAVRKTLESNQAVYWSRSRQRLWLKGESSGHIQKIIDIRLDCDADTLLLLVEQVGGIACHTGRESCMFKSYFNVPEKNTEGWVDIEPVIKDPKDIY